MMLRSILIKSAIYVRAIDWILKVIGFLIASLILIFFTEVYSEHWKTFIIVLIHQCFFYSFAYSFNNFHDVFIDKLKEIKNPMLQYDKKFNMTILSSLAFFSIFATLFSYNPLLISIGLLNLFLAIAYSMRPIRLKERGVYGLVPPILGQRVLPFFMFAFFASDDYRAIIYFIIYFLLLGLIGILEHQILDYENDLKLKVKTFTTDIGRRATIKSKMFTIVILLIIIFSAPIFFELGSSIFVISILIPYSLLKIKGKNLLRRMVKRQLIKS